MAIFILFRFTNKFFFSSPKKTYTFTNQNDTMNKLLLKNPFFIPLSAFFCCQEYIYNYTRDTRKKKLPTDNYRRLYPYQWLIFMQYLFCFVTDYPVTFILVSCAWVHISLYSFSQFLFSYLVSSMCFLRLPLFYSFFFFLLL